MSQALTIHLRRNRFAVRINSGAKRPQRVLAMPNHHGILIIIQGLAGSGKSHLIQFLKYDFLIEENFAVSDESEERNINDLAANLRCGRRCIVSERKYRSNIERGKFIAKVLQAVSPSHPPTIKIICFENDLKAANYNCENRGNKPGDIGGRAHIIQNECDSKTYEIPSDAVVIKIHRMSTQILTPSSGPPEVISLRGVVRKDA